MSNLLEDYESYLTTEKKASANTVSSYLRDVHQFAQEMEERDVPLDEVLTRDVEDYIRAKAEALRDYECRTAWAEKMLVNIARSGYFSSDRTIRQYNEDIWHLN